MAYKPVQANCQKCDKQVNKRSLCKMERKGRFGTTIQKVCQECLHKIMGF